MSITLKQAETAIRDRIEFFAGASTQYSKPSLRGEFNEHGDFEVYSYQALIAVRFLDGTAWVTDRKYSVTTSKHTSLARRALSVFVAPLPSLDD